MYDLIIVGGGPSALRALADLDVTLAAVPPQRRLRILVIEPHTPGSGRVWDPSQPSHLILNADSAIVDMRCPSVEHSYREWAQSAERFPARAGVGAYLEWAFGKLRGSNAWTLSHRAARARAVVRSADGLGYEVHIDAGDDAPPVVVHGREVLLATGHVRGTVPDHRAISGGDASARESVVVVRGAALTGFDVVSDLTIGRGGTFERAPQGELRYHASGREPAKVVLWSRTGETMLPKPESTAADEVAAVRRHTAALRQRSDLSEGWWRVLGAAAIAAAASHGVAVGESELAAAWESAPTDAADVSDEVSVRWRADLARAHGEVDADVRWWWGRAWAAGYEDVIRGLDRVPRTEAAWQTFRARAARLERWAFGPPVVTIERLLCLREAGLLQVHRGEATPLTQPDAVVFDAVTPGPGVLRTARPWGGDDGLTAGAHDPLWQRLLDAELVTVRPGERGVITSADAQCVRPDGALSSGLCALGRPTEDPTIGHDSLQRSLRPEFHNWAAGFLRRSVESPTSAEHDIISQDQGVSA